MAHFGRTLLCLQLVLLLPLPACDRAAEEETSAWDQLTIYQKTAIQMCNEGAARVRELHRLAERSKTKTLYDALAAPTIENTIATQSGEHESATFGEFLAEFAGAEALFVWENRRASPSELDRRHLDWCHGQDDWVSSYR